ncbi:MAG: DUF481 domain-containing protein [Moraxellaceae bacterium]
MLFKALKSVALVVLTASVLLPAAQAEEADEAKRINIAPVTGALMSAEPPAEASTAPEPDSSAPAPAPADLTPVVTSPASTAPPSAAPPSSTSVLPAAAVPALSVKVSATPQWPAEAGEYDPLWDWIQVNTREWFKGRIKSMEHGKIVFDSDKVGILNLDWDDIRVLRSARAMAVFYNESSLVVGRLTTEGNNLVVHAANQNSHILMENVVSLAAGTPVEIDYWSADISLSMNFRSGNTDETDISSTATVQRRTARTNLKFNYRGNFSVTNDVQDTNDHRINFTTDILLDRYWYVRPLSVEYFHDSIQNVDSQWTLGFGAGYFIFDQAKLRWSATAGPGYQMSRFIEAPEGDSLKENTPALLLSTNYYQELTSTVDLTGTYQVTYTSEDSGHIERNATFSLDVDVTKDLDLTVGLTWDRIEKPQPDANGVTPKKEDVRLSVGFKYEL